MENSYGIGIANRYDLFYGQDDVTEFETVVSKKKKEKKEPAAAGQLPQPAAPPKSAAEKENKAQPKPTNAAAPPKAQSQDARKDPRKGIKEQNNTGKKDGELTKFGTFSEIFHKKCAPPSRGGACVLVSTTATVFVVIEKLIFILRRCISTNAYQQCDVLMRFFGSIASLFVPLVAFFHRLSATSFCAAA